MRISEGSNIWVSHNILVVPVLCLTSILLLSRWPWKECVPHKTIEISIIAGPAVVSNCFLLPIFVCCVAHLFSMSFILLDEGAFSTDLTLDIEPLARFAGATLVLGIKLLIGCIRVTTGCIEILHFGLHGLEGSEGAKLRPLFQHLSTSIALHYSNYKKPKLYEDR
eukprot:Gb_04882 [translate_table: standard]